MDLHEGHSKEIRAYLRVSKADIGDHKLVIACDPNTAIGDLKSLFPFKDIISSNWILESLCCYELLPTKEFMLA